MPSQKFHIPKISCGHCTRTIENELKEVAGVQKVESDILAKTVTVNFQSPATEEQIRATLKEIDYPAA